MPFIALPSCKTQGNTQGNTHYELIDNTSASATSGTVVLIHGATVPMWVFDRQMSALVAAGHRVLRYDQFGKGQSDYPTAKYDRTFYLDQLKALLDALAIVEPVTLVGFSFGGACAAHFAARYPERVACLVLIAPVVCYEAGNKLVRLARTPWIGGLLLRWLALPKATARAGKLWSTTNITAADNARYEQLFRTQLAVNGFTPALLAQLRGDAFGDYRETYRDIGTHPRPAMLIWGNSDADIPAADIAFIREAMPNIEYHELANASHGLLFHDAETVNDLAVRFLGGEASNGKVGSSAVEI